MEYDMGQAEAAGISQLLVYWRRFWKVILLAALPHLITLLSLHIPKPGGCHWKTGCFKSALGHLGCGVCSSTLRQAASQVWDERCYCVGLRVLGSRDSPARFFVSGQC